MGALTTHVLDISRGRPAGNMTVDLYRYEGDARTHLVTTTTTPDGRVASALLSGPDFRAGSYELVFHVAEYFGSPAGDESGPPFLDLVSIRFGVSAPEEKYHVPLLVSPWSYSTYRGS